MSVLRVLGRTAALALLAGRRLARGGVRTGRFVGRRVAAARQRGGSGEAGMMRLLDLHAASCAGDTLVAIALAGTIFFNVPVGEARGSVALYLLVTMLPFALLAPVVGPLLDRFRHGRRYALATTMLGRCFLAYVISEHIEGLALYPAAFGVLILSRAYGVARSAAVPRVLPAGVGLSEAGARASVFGTVAAAVVAPFGIAAAAAGPEWALRMATILFAFGMVFSLRLPPRADSQPPEVLPRLFQLPGHKGAKVLSGRLVVNTLAGSATLRAAYGFLALFLAFAIRSGDLPTSLPGWKVPTLTAIGGLAGCLALGSFAATAIGTRLHIHRPALLQGGAVVAVALVALAATVRFTLPMVALLCLVTAIGSGLAKLTVDAVIQERVPGRIRASAFAHSETLLMLAWVAGGALGLIPFAGRLGLGVLTGCLALGAVRAVLVTHHLRKERLRGAPAPDEEKDGEETVTVDLAAGREAAKARPGRRWRRSHRDAAKPATPAKPADPATPAKPAKPAKPATPGPPEPAGKEPATVELADTTTADTTTADTTADTTAETRDAGTVRESGTRVLLDPDTDQPTGYHLYRPSGTDPTLRLEDDDR